MCFEEAVVFFDGVVLGFFTCVFAFSIAYNFLRIGSSLQWIFPCSVLDKKKILFQFLVAIPKRVLLLKGDSESLEKSEVVFKNDLVNAS